jgi:hypothetical protein
MRRGMRGRGAPTARGGGQGVVRLAAVYYFCESCGAVGPAVFCNVAHTNCSFVRQAEPALYDFV